MKRRGRSRLAIMSNRIAKLAARFCAAFFVAALGGCAALEMLEPPGARSQMSAGFSPESFERLAVIVEDETAPRYRLAQRGGIYREIEDEFVHQLMGKGYVLAARSDLHQIIAEGEFQRQSGLTAADAVRIGEISNVTAVLIVTITEAEVTSDLRTFTVISSGDGQRKERRRVYQGYAGVGARLIDVETGDLLWIGSHSGRHGLPGRDQVGQAIRPVAAKVAEAFPAKEVEKKEL